MAVKPNFKFERLIRPYKQGGTENHQVVRTVGVQVDWLVNKRSYPLDIVGGALLVVYTKLYHNQIKFLGDGTWGSKGHQLDQYLLKTCEELYQKRLQSELGTALMERLLVDQVAKLIQLTLPQRFWRWFNKASERTGHWL
jgi:hypothetical protein